MPQEVIQPIAPISPIPPISVPALQQGTEMPVQKYDFKLHVQQEAERLKRTPKLYLDKPKEVISGDEWKRPFVSPSVMSVPDQRGWLRKQADDVGMLASGVYHIVRAAVTHLPEAPEYAMQLMNELVSDPELVARKAGHTFKQILNAASMNYQDPEGNINFNSVLTGVKDHSLLALLDALGLLSLGATSSLKLAPIAGRLAELSGMAANIAKPVVKAGVLGTKMVTKLESGMMAAGKFMQDIPSLAFESALKGAETLPPIKGLLTHYGITQRAREFFRIVGTERLQANYEGYQAARAGVKLKIPKELHQDFEDVLLGAKSWNEALYPEVFNQKIKEIVKIQRKYIGDARTENLKWGSGEITDEALFQSKMKHLADRLKITPEEAREVFMRNSVATATYNPDNWNTFKDSFRMAVEDYHLDPAKVFSDMFVVDPAFGQTMKRVGAWERFTGRAKFSKDPDVYHTNYIVANAHLKGTILGYNAGNARFARPWVHGAELPAGMVDMPAPYFKYVDHLQQANGLVMKRLDEGQAKFGVGTPEAFAYVWDTVRTDLVPMSQELIDSAMAQGKVRMIIPKDIAKAIDFDMAPVMGWTRQYNNALNVWRKFVLDWSPRYYVNNVLGNSVLMVLGGVSPKALRTWAYDNMANEAGRASLKLEDSGLLGTIGRSPVMRAVGSGTNWLAEKTDALPRVVTTNSYLRDAIQERGILDETLKKWKPDYESGVSDLDGIVQLAYNLDVRRRDVMAKYARMSSPDFGGIEEAAHLEVREQLAVRMAYLKATKQEALAQAEFDAAKAKLRQLEQKLGTDPLASTQRGPGLGLQGQPEVTQVPGIRPPDARPLSGVVGFEAGAPKASSIKEMLPDVNEVNSRWTLTQHPTKSGVPDGYFHLGFNRPFTYVDGSGKQVKAPGLAAEVEGYFESPGVLKIDVLRAYEKGGGGQALKELVDLADAKGVTIKLTPAPLPKASKAARFDTAEELQGWYSRFGFTKEKYAHDSWVRLPKSARPSADAQSGMQISTAAGSLPAIERIADTLQKADEWGARLTQRISALQREVKELDFNQHVHSLGSANAQDVVTPGTKLRVIGAEARDLLPKKIEELERAKAALADVNQDIIRLKRHGKNVRQAQEVGIPSLQKKLAESSFRLDTAKSAVAQLKTEGEAVLSQIGMQSGKHVKAHAIERMNGEALREAMQTAGTLRQYLKEIEPFTAPVEKAVKEMELLLGAYGRGSPMARKYIRNAIPFWTFMATMHRLAAHMPVWRPKTTMLYSQMVQMAVDSYDDGRLPSWAAESLPVGTMMNPQGDPITVFMRVSGLNPFESIGTRELGKLELPKLLDPTQNPLFALGSKMVGGTETYTRELPDWQRGEIIDYAGRSWRYDGSGGFEKTSRQKPLLDAFFEMFPQTQIYNDLMSHVGFKINGKAGDDQVFPFSVPGRHAKVMKSPEGETILARPWSFGVARAFGFTPDQVDLEQAKLKENMNMIRLARQFMRAAARDRDIDDQERAQIFKEAGYALQGLNINRRGAASLRK